MIPKWQTVVSSRRANPNRPEEIFELGIEYVIAGYQGGTPRLCVLNFILIGVPRRSLDLIRCGVKLSINLTFTCLG